MSATSWFWLAIMGWLLITMSALAAKIINELAWHDLKEFCKRWPNGKQQFEQIHDHHDALVLGMETLRVVGGVILLGGTVGWMVFTATAQELPPREFALVLAGVFAALLIGAVWLPAAVARVWGVQILVHGWRVFRVAGLLVYPLAAVALLLEAAANRMAGELTISSEVEQKEREKQEFEEEIRTIVTEGQYDGHLDAETREMIEGVIQLDEIDVADIMTPQSSMDRFPVDYAWAQVLHSVAECGRTRIPVYEDQEDNIIGILYVKDLLAELSREGKEPTRPLREILRPVTFVSQEQKLDTLLKEFLKSRVHLAMVLDEFDNVAGLVTIEDVLEEIVGEIVDERDSDQTLPIHTIDDHTAFVHGRAHLSEINEKLGLDLPESEEYNTIGGLVMSRFRRVPRPGDSLSLGSVNIEVTQASKKKVNRVRIESGVALGKDF